MNSDLCQKHTILNQYRVDHFKRPKYQVKLGIQCSVNKRQSRGRCLPDVAGYASPGYDIPVHGQRDPKGRGRTITAVPLWSGLVALINQSIGKPVGFINPCTVTSKK